MRIVQWLLAFVFAITAGLKVAAMVTAGEGAVDSLYNTLPIWEQWAVVVVELILAVWLATGWQPRWGALAVIGVLSVFMGAVIVEMGKPHPKPCGCFGTLATGSVVNGLWISLSMDVLMLLGALWVYFGALHHLGKVSKPAPSTPPPSAVPSPENPAKAQRDY